MKCWECFQLVGEGSGIGRMLVWYRMFTRQEHSEIKSKLEDVKTKDCRCKILGQRRFGGNHPENQAWRQRHGR